MEDERNENDQNKNSKIQKNILEWIVFSSSLLLILGVLAYLTYQTIIYQPSSPNLRVEYAHDPSKDAPYRYHLTIINSGGQTAEEVKVEASLEKDGKTIEKAELTIPFSPKASKSEGWVNFKTNPSNADSLLARVVGFKKP